MNISQEEVLIKVQWKIEDGSWTGELVTSDEDRFNRRYLTLGSDLDFEVSSNRRCVGYVDDEGRNPCPEFKKVESGKQCFSCRNKDIHRDYIEGRTGESRSGKHSVYLAQIGGDIKVGVTRTDRLIKRWIEQGAIYATEIEVCDNASGALEIESDISNDGINERISKKRKSTITEDGPKLLDSMLSEMDLRSKDIIDVQSKSAYPVIYRSSKAKRKGKFSGKLKSVRGQLLFTEGQCFAVTKGRCIVPSEQKSITDF